jgi:BRCT domain type II-containing protein
MAKREPRIRGWMKRNNITDDRFRVEWVSAGEGKKWQTIMNEMSEVVETYKKSVPAPKKTKTKPKPKSKTKKAQPKSKAKPKAKSSTTKKSASKKKKATSKK